MSVYVDTSALLALLDADDLFHERALAALSGLRAAGERLVCSNYVMLETLALVQHRLGLDAVRAFQRELAPVLVVDWVDEELHARGVASVLAASRRGLSLVDCVSFVTMGRLGLHRVFTFDAHFAEQGFELVPSPQR